MSDERLDELGLRRRAFLKRAAAAGFAAPLVVSFGMDGVAMAKRQRSPNQGPDSKPPQYPNQPQFPNQTF